MSDFNYQPLNSAQISRRPRVRVAAFGDGYEQRVADGINTNPQVWSLSFTNTRAIIDTIEALLIGYGGVTRFTWTPSGMAEIKVVCREWNRTKVNRRVDSLSATFEQVFES